MPNVLFISYSRADVEEVNWLVRFRMYLAPFDKQGLIDPWHDGRILPGQKWEAEITTALEGAAAAVLLVGPGFLASDFVMGREVPPLLEAASQRGVALFPLIVGYCAYAHSPLAPYQAFNKLDTPLESLPRAEQNRILNDLAIAVVEQRRQATRENGTPSSPKSLYAAMQTIDLLRRDCRTAFVAQAGLRDALVARIEQRLGIVNDLEYERFFFRHHPDLTVEERFEFKQIRAITEGGLHDGNRKILDLIDADPQLLSVIPEMSALRQHLVYWLNKFERVFKLNRAMCVLYTGVEDGVPFPATFDSSLDRWMTANRT